MPIKEPQRDLPGGIRGGSDLWDATGGAVLRDDWFSAAPASTAVLTGANCQQPVTASAGAVIQTHALAGPAAQLPVEIDGLPLEVDGLPVYVAGSADNQATTSTTGAVGSAAPPVVLDGQPANQATTSTAGAVVQTHTLAGAHADQTATATAGAAAQTHTLAGNSAQQPTTATAGAAQQQHALAGAPSSSQLITATAAAVTQTHLLAGAASRQDTTSTSGAFSEAVTAVLQGNNAQQPATATAGAVQQQHMLAGNAASQPTTATAGAAVQVHVLQAAPAAVDHIASQSAIVQAHLLQGQGSTQGATSTSGAFSLGGEIDWSVTGARAIAPPATVRAIAPNFDAVGIVPAANIRAIAPASGDDMEPIKTVEQYRQDREVYEIDFEAKYLTQANDTAATLKAVGSDAGITVTPQVAPGGVLASGVVKLAVDDPATAGDYKVWAQITTTAGRERTGVIVVRVEDL